MIRRTERRSRRTRRCEPCGGRIDPGDRYLSVVASPGHGDLGNPTWWRLDECEPCAVRRGVMTIRPNNEGNPA